MKIKVRCAECSSELYKVPSRIRENNFCNRSCANSYNNRKNPKRKAEHKCKTCGNPVTSRKRYCSEDCNPKGRDMTLAEALYVNHHKSSAYALVRCRARAIARKENMNTCIKCGYSKHVEIAHVNPISNFPEDTLVSVVNSLDNIMPLCPNCHWEYDHPEECCSSS